MITPTQIVAHIQAYLPRFTDIFNITPVVSGASITDVRTVQVTTVSPHGLSVGDSIMVPQGRVENAIVGVTQVGDNLEFTTQFTHDLTNADGPLDDVDLTLDGFVDTQYNADFNIQTITAQDKFQIINPATTVPTLTGQQMLVEDRRLGVRGIPRITATPDTTTFSFTIDDRAPDLPLTGVRDLSIVTGVRVSAVRDTDRAEQMYSNMVEPRNAYLFVIMDEFDVSKDRHTDSDAEMAATAADAQAQLFLQNFNTVVFYPTDQELSGANAQDLAYGETFEALFSVLFGAPFVTATNRADYRVVSRGHGPLTGFSNRAFYVHSYMWQLPERVAFDLGSIGTIIEDVAFRRLDASLKQLDVNNPDSINFSINYL